MGFFKKKKIKKTEFLHDPEAFIQFLRSGDKEQVEFGQTALVAAGTDVLDPMIKILIDEKEDKTIRNRAGQVLSLIGEPAIFPLLAVIEELKFTSKSASETIGIIASVLGGMGEQVIEPMIWALKSPILEVRFGAAVALVQTGREKAINAVKDAAAQGDEKNKAMMKMVLGND